MEKTEFQRVPSLRFTGRQGPHHTVQSRRSYIDVDYGNYLSPNVDEGGTVRPRFDIGVNYGFATVAVWVAGYRHIHSITITKSIGMGLCNGWLVVSGVA